MTDTRTENYCPDIDISLTQIKRFKETVGFFSILLEDGSIIHHTPDDENLFRHWLLENNIPEIK